MFMLKETVEKIVVRVIDVLGDISIRTMWCLVLLPAFSFALLRKIIDMPAFVTAFEAVH